MSIKSSKLYTSEQPAVNESFHSLLPVFDDFRGQLTELKKTKCLNLLTYDKINNVMKTGDSTEESIRGSQTFSRCTTSRKPSYSAIHHVSKLGDMFIWMFVAAHHLTHDQLHHCSLSLSGPSFLELWVRVKVAAF